MKRVLKKNTLLVFLLLFFFFFDFFDVIFIFEEKKNPCKHGGDENKMSVGTLIVIFFFFFLRLTVRLKSNHGVRGTSTSTIQRTLNSVASICTTSDYSKGNNIYCGDSRIGGDNLEGKRAGTKIARVSRYPIDLTKFDGVARNVFRREGKNNVRSLRI
jgi:hypothetical protein